MENLSKIPKILGYESIYIQPHFHVLVYSTHLYLILAFLKRCMGKGDLTVDPLPPIVPNTCHVNKNSLPKSHHHSHHPSFDSTSTSPRRCSLNDNLNATLSSRKSVPACTPTKGKQRGVVTEVNSPKSTPSRRLLNNPSSCSSVGVSGHPLQISDAEKCKYTVLAARCLMIFGCTFFSRELFFLDLFRFWTPPPLILYHFWRLENKVKSFSHFMTRSLVSILSSMAIYTCRIYRICLNRTYRILQNQTYRTFLASFLFGLLN